MFGAQGYDHVYIYPRAPSVRFRPCPSLTRFLRPESVVQLPLCLLVNSQFDPHAFWSLVQVVG